MRCLKPRTVGFQTDGKTLCWSPKNYSNEYPTFQLPCGKCRYCRLEYARQWAVRATHEAQMHEENSFITLTYSSENLTSGKLHYSEFQTFIRALRDKYPEKEISYIACGEYGEKNQRPHWHAILFGFKPSDLTFSHKNKNDDDLYNSKIIDDLWKKNDPEKCPTEIGSVSFKSANYVARYAFKKQKSPNNDDPEFKPIFKTSRKYAIGKRWLEKFYTDIFDHGQCRLDTGKKMVNTSIPRYYEKWLMKHKLSEWKLYVTQTKIKNIERAKKSNQKLIDAWKNENMQRPYWKGYTLTHLERQAVILDERLKLLTTSL